MILFNYSSTASSTKATVSVAEAVTVEVQATAIAQRLGAPANPAKVILKLGADGTEISSALNNLAVSGTINVVAEASVGMLPNNQYTLEVVGLPPSNGSITSVGLKATIVTIAGQARLDAGVADDTKPRRRKSR
jgi:hypothetical protein